MPLTDRKRTLACLLALLAVPVAAAQHGPRPVASKRDADGARRKRDWGTTLWADQPDYTGVIQRELYDCWFAAASMAVTYVSPFWTENMYYRADTGAALANTTGPAMSSVNVSIWNHHDLTPHNYTADIAAYEYTTLNTEDTPGGNWWHAAMLQALFSMATAFPQPGTSDPMVSEISGTFGNWTFVPYEGDVAAALTMLTGKAATQVMASSIASADDLFTYLAKAPATPVCISTPNTVNESYVQPIQPDHAYAIINATVNADGSKTVTARNPWGAFDYWPIEYVYQNLYGVQYLTNNDSLVWSGQNWA